MPRGELKSAKWCWPADETVGRMNLSPRWVKTLTEAGIEAAHWSDVGRANAPDSEIMAFARANGYVVLTHDLDFSAILAATQGAKPSVVQIRAEDVRPETLAPTLIEALRQMAGQLDEGALLTVDPARARLRVLPLGSK
jgi:predicted nuclease of predicted toxin-antitoxin system